MSTSMERMMPSVGLMMVEQFNRVLGFEGILKGAGFPDLLP